MDSMKELRAVRMGLSKISPRITKLRDRLHNMELAQTAMILRKWRLQELSGEVIVQHTATKIIPSFEAMWTTMTPEEKLRKLQEMEATL
uniref:Uncharacterized protein n=1 Tax=viral metagenome TaxID=1070528 RepID=A0A6M3K8L5_9ZZZZ